MNYNCTEELLRLINKSNEIAVENEMLKKENQSLKDWVEFLEGNEQKLLNDNLDLIEENENLKSKLERMLEGYEDSLVEIRNMHEKEIEVLEEEKSRLKCIMCDYRKAIDKLANINTELKDKVDILEGHKLHLQEDYKGLEMKLFKNKIEIERNHVVINEYRNKLKELGFTL